MSRTGLFEFGLSAPRSASRPRPPYRPAVEVCEERVVLSGMMQGPMPSFDGVDHTGSTADPAVVSESVQLAQAIVKLTKRLHNKIQHANSVGSVNSALHLLYQLNNVVSELEDVLPDDPAIQQQADAFRHEGAALYNDSVQIKLAIRGHNLLGLLDKGLKAKHVADKLGLDSSRLVGPLENLLTH